MIQKAINVLFLTLRTAEFSTV